MLRSGQGCRPDLREPCNDLLDAFVRDPDVVKEVRNALHPLRRVLEDLQAGWLVDRGGGGGGVRE